MQFLGPLLEGFQLPLTLRQLPAGVASGYAVRKHNMDIRNNPYSLLVCDTPICAVHVCAMCVMCHHIRMVYCCVAQNAEDVTASNSKAMDTCSKFTR